MPVYNLAEPNKYLPGVGFVKRSFLLIGSNLLKLFVQLAIIFLYSRHLSLKDYGLYQSVWLYINIAGVIALFGLPSIILSASAKNIKAWINANGNYFYPLVLLMNILPVLYIFFGNSFFDFHTKMLLTALTVAQNISIIAETIAIKKEKEIRVLISNIIFITGYFICHFLILKNGYNLQVLLSWLILVYIIKSAFLWNISSKAISVSNISLKSLGTQWIYLGLFDVISVLFKWLDKWLILFFVSVTQFAIYYNGAYEIPVFALMLSAVGNIMVVELSRHSLNPEKVKLLFNNSSLFLASIVFPSFCFFFFYHYEVFTFIFSSKYQESIPVFLISIFIIPLRITNFTAALQVYDRSDLVLKGAVIDLFVAVVLVIILYPLLKFQGLALAFVLSTYVQAGYYLWHTAELVGKKIGYFIPFVKLIILMLISIIITGAFYFAFGKSVLSYNLLSGIIICTILIGSFLSWYLWQKKVTIA